MSDRSHLFVPGDDEDAIESAKQSGTDAIIVDLEDTVLKSAKASARHTTVRTVEEWSADDPTLYVRVNGLDTEFVMADVEALIDCAAVPEAIVVPDVRSATEVQIVTDKLDSASSDIGLVPLIERPEAVFRVHEIAGASERTIMLAFGSVDFRMNIGMSALDSNADVYLPRYLISMAASAVGCRALDTVFLDRENDAGLRAETKEARQIGFDGKMAIAESQIPNVNEGFAPTERELDRARRLVDAFEAADAGVVYFEGTFVDRPVVEEQRRLLDHGAE
ncbi:HpcH/HpaI aldolase/citrate lyase family protein [Halococcus salifodinae]|uniref:Citrate lyase beta subunit n=1 Tax=Halococcus salifodinae DSM 8989 TaxID=1227456 RepID=M0NB13_9EURY|nr:CoA ester lyase [Halococcus salifodinae]EMA54763.1 citrate lyase beta subunit [Halococcus salifodinae DSM 8989]